MQWIGELNAGTFVLFTLVLSRVSGLMMTAPIYGTQDIPVQVRALFAVAISLLVFPSQWGVSVPDPENLVWYLVLVGSELAVGAALGWGVTIFFSGLEVAGQLIDQVSGLTMAEIFDPTQGTNVSIISRLLNLVALAVFVVIGGHRLVMTGLLDTFQAMPAGSVAMNTQIGPMLVTLVAQCFELGVRAAAPVIASLLLANLVLGLIARALPQLNVLAVGFGINVLLALGILGISIGSAVWLFANQLEPSVATLLKGLTHGRI